MEKRGIVFGPKSDIKRERARGFRRAMTPAEICLWEELRGNRCAGLHVRRQQVIDGFIADFYCHEAGLIIEVDGGVHQQQADYDLIRDRIIAARSLRVMRFPNDRIFSELPAVLREIQTAARNAQSPNSPPVMDAKES
jgi:very-short-patch-repair endonuclease